jgi:hypothetical protein
VNGRRRAGPNRWGYDPHAPVLEGQPTRARPHRICVKAAEHWSSPETFHTRHRTHHELVLRPKKGAHRQRSGKTIGTYNWADVEPKQHKRGDRVSVQHRIMGVCLLRAGIVSGRVGIWDGQESKPCNREQLARYVGVPFRYDEKGIARCDRLDRALKELVAAGLLRRFQTGEEKDGVYYPDAATLKVTPLAWLVSGVAPQRQRIVAKANKGQRKEEHREQDEATAQAVAFLGRLALDHQPSYGPTAPPAGRCSVCASTTWCKHRRPPRRRSKPDDPPTSH